MVLLPSCSCIFSIHWSQVLSREWRRGWSCVPWMPQRQLTFFLIMPQYLLISITMGKYMTIPVLTFNVIIHMIRTRHWIWFLRYFCCGRYYCQHIESLSTRIWDPSQYPKRRLSVRSRKVSKPRDLYLELSDRSEIWQALRQQCCRCACQILKRYDNLKYQSRGFETLRDLTKRRLFGYWHGAQVPITLSHWWNMVRNTSITFWSRPQCYPIRKIFHLES